MIRVDGTFLEKDFKISTGFDYVIKCLKVNEDDLDDWRDANEVYYTIISEIIAIEIAVYIMRRTTYMCFENWEVLVERREHLLFLLNGMGIKYKNPNKKVIENW